MSPTKKRLARAQPEHIKAFDEHHVAKKAKSACATLLSKNTNQSYYSNTKGYLDLG
jgi:hypothetical protein